MFGQCHVLHRLWTVEFCSPLQIAISPDAHFPSLTLNGYGHTTLNSVPEFLLVAVTVEYLCAWGLVEVKVVSWDWYLLCVVEATGCLFFLPFIHSSYTFSFNLVCVTQNEDYISQFSLVYVVLSKWMCIAWYCDPSLKDSWDFTPFSFMLPGMGTRMAGVGVAIMNHKITPVMEALNREATKSKWSVSLGAPRNSSVSC